MKRTIAFATATLALSACGDIQVPEAAPEGAVAVDGSSAAAKSAPNVLDQINESLADQGFGVLMAEIYTDPESGEMGNVIFANDRGNKQLTGDFVPGDPRRGTGDDIVYVVDISEGTTSSGLTTLQTTGALDDAMSTWESVQCSDIHIVDGGDIPFDIGVVQAILGFGGNGVLFTDLMHAGWLPQAFFDMLRPGGGSSILGVTFTFNWVDATGAPTDVDNNGKADVAFREIYYNDAFPWQADGVNNFDVETVALHEAGHGLSQGHFGKIFRSGGNGKLHFSPRAVMNASYSGIQRSIGKTDNAGHCSNWGSWPNN